MFRGFGNKVFNRSDLATPSDVVQEAVDKCSQVFLLNPFGIDEIIEAVGPTGDYRLKSITLDVFRRKRNYNSIPLPVTKNLKRNASLHGDNTEVGSCRFQYQRVEFIRFESDEQSTWLYKLAIRN